MFNRFGCVVLLVGVLVCLYLTVTTGFLVHLLNAKPLYSVPLHVNGVALAHSSHQSPASHQTQAHSYSVLGSPSLRPAFVELVLSRAHSSAQGIGQALYDLSLAYHIDDAFALAFFEHESAFGTTGVAPVTHSLGNIKCSAGYACISGFRAYDTWVQGATDWFHLISTLYIQAWHLTTVEQIIPVYAPPSDGNNVAGYIAAVEQAVNGWRQEGGSAT